ncbi:MAG TPA: ATP-binding protein, partial [Leptospiraceae bacterium]|nr:ATP-binding protein [Leptospiraceae bacterium]
SDHFRVAHNIFSLKFFELNLEKEFLDFNLLNSIFQARIAAFLGLLLYPSFLLVDFILFKREDFEFSVYLRLSITIFPILFSFLYSIFADLENKSTIDWIERIAIFTVLSAQLGHCALLFFTSSSPYYDLAVTTIILFFIFGITKIRFIFNVYLLLLTDLLFGVSLYVSQKCNNEVFFAILFILTSFSICALLVGYIAEYQNRRKFILLKKLNEEKQNNIETKNELESVNLSEILQFQQTNLDYNSIEGIKDFQYEGEIELDRSRMRRVIGNLIQNSIEVMYDGRKPYYVKVFSREEGDTCVIGVEDNGPGLPESLQKKIFEAFATEGKAKGTGLGLFMSKWIVESHGGSLTYQTTSGEGTTFYIKIPKKNKKEKQ